MKTKPILFSTTMVQAILENRKTQTRRIVKPIPRLSDKADETAKYLIEYPSFMNMTPYQIGDKLWVRETHDKQNGCLGSILYKADYSQKELKTAAKGVFKWTSSIHMKKEHARIWLEITDVKIERLHDISDVDAIAEGIIPDPGDIPFNPKSKFMHLWESIHNEESVNANPYLYVISFKVLSTTGKTQEA